MGMLEKDSSNIKGTQVWNLLINEVLGRLNTVMLSIRDCIQSDHSGALLPPESFVFLIKSQNEGSISGKIVKKVLEVIFDPEDPELDPGKIVKENNWYQITDDAVIRELCIAVLEDKKHANEVSRYVDGSAPKIFGFFVGKVLKNSGGKANPQLVNFILKELLDAKRASS